MSICGASAVTIAAEYGNTGVIRVLLTRGADLQNDHENTALMYAAEYGHPSVMTLLLAARADVTLRDRDGETALMIAQRRGDAITVQLLKSAGAEE